MAHNKINPLIVHWKAKDIPEVMAGLETIPADILVTEYFPYPYNYRITRKFFLDHPEYTHLIADPNDIIVTNEHYQQLKKQVEQNDYPILSGVCNVDLDKYSNRWNICLELPNLDYHHRRYYWVPDSQDLGTIQVKFAGFPFMFIRRDIIEKIPFYHIPKEHPQSDMKGRGMMELRGGWAGDLAFCTSCDFYDIPIMANTDCKIRHLRYCGEMKVGKENPHVWFIPKDKSEKRDITNLFSDKYYGSKIQIQGSSQKL